MEKYELTNDTIELGSRTLYRIKALISFGDVKKGDLGGYIEKENNLHQYNNAWVYDNARVYGNAMVYGNVRVLDNARVYDNAWVYGNAEVSGNARVFGNARVNKGICTERIINLINLCEYDITKYNNYIIVGCKSFTKEEWSKLLEDDNLFLDECRDKESQQKLHKTLIFLLDA